MKRSYLKSKSPIKRKKCKECGKNRKIEFYLSQRARICDGCKIAIKAGKKREAKKKTKKYWIKKLDKLVGTKVRSRRLCDSPRSHECNRSWQWAHGLSRSYHQTRWDENNGFCLCNKEHLYFTHRPLEWEAFLESVWGGDGLREMKRKALDHSKPIDYEALYNELKLP